MILSQDEMYQGQSNLAPPLNNFLEETLNGKQETVCGMLIHSNQIPVVCAEVCHKSFLSLSINPHQQSSHNLLNTALCANACIVPVNHFEHTSVIWCFHVDAEATTTKDAWVIWFKDVLLSL